MAEKDLHDIIKEILKQEGKPLLVREIFNVISKNNLWKKPSDGLSPSSNQISARISKYPALFMLKNGLVHLAIQEKRLLRITWNENNWEIPSGHRWSKEKQGDTNTAYENQYGFGGEEWLFNTRYNIDGFQYGYVRGLWEVMNIDYIDIAYLFSINSETKERLLIAKLKNVELLNPDELPKKVINYFEKYKYEMVNEIKNVNADYSKFKHREFYPIVKFKMEDAEIFDIPISINELKKGNKYNRFKPYIIDDELQELIDGKISIKPFVFSPGKRKNENSVYIKTTSAKTTDIKGIHAQIVNELETYLKPNFNLKSGNISVEKTVFGENIADVVIQHKDKSYTIYEVKTSHNTRYNVRDAIGQLLDYALWHKDIKIKDLIVVAPSVITSDQIEYLKRLKATLKLNLRYLKYDSSATDKFTEIAI
ncbi:MAG TPA: hypothetical protein PKX72_04240 [Chitinophagales bacterium]|nr:hypothetical protein [Chitinophagales bacterium]